MGISSKPPKSAASFFTTTRKRAVTKVSMAIPSPTPSEGSAGSPGAPGAPGAVTIDPARAAAASEATERIDERAAGERDPVREAAESASMPPIVTSGVMSEEDFVETAIQSAKIDVGDDYNLLKKFSLSKVRPEILAAMYLHENDSVTSRGNGSDVRNIVNFRHAQHSLLTKMATQFHSTRLGIELLEATGEQNAAIESIPSNIANLEAIVQKIDAFEDSVNIKKYDTDDSKASDFRSITYRGYTDFDRASGADPLSIYTILDQRLGFRDNEQLKTFSGTKVISQLVHDLRNSILHHTPAFISNESSLNRQSDESPYKVNMEDDVSEFDAMSRLSTIDTIDTRTFYDIARVLPSYGSSEKRALVSLNYFLKELLVSAGFGYLSTSTGRSSVGPGTGLGRDVSGRDTINNLYGVVNRDIGQPNGGDQNNIAKLLKLSLQDNPNSLLLPFESREVFDENSNKRLLAGTKVLIDSVMDRVNALTSTDLVFGPVQALRNFNNIANLEVERITKITNIILNLLPGGEIIDSDSPPSTFKLLHGETIIQNFATIIRDSLQGVILSGTDTNAEDLILLVAVSKSYADDRMRSSLFEYVRILNNKALGIPNSPEEINNVVSVLVEMVFSSSRSGHAPTSSTILGNQSDVGSILKNPFTATDSHQNIFEKLITSYIDCKTSARDLANFNSSSGSYLSGAGDSSNRRTRFNNISEDGMLFMLFESFISLMLTLRIRVNAEFERSPSDPTPVLFMGNDQINPTSRIGNANESCDAFIEGRRLPGNLTYESLVNIKNKMIAERNFFIESISVINSTFKRFKDTQDDITEYFLGTSPEVTYIKSLTNTVYGQNILDALDSQQISLMKQTFQNFFKPAQYLGRGVLGPNLGQRDLISANDKNDIINLLHNNPSFSYPNGGNITVLSVGMPTGMTKYLINGPETLSTGLGSDQARPIVRISVYRRDLEYPDLILKPKTYLFDAHLYYELDENAQISRKLYNLSSPIDGTPIQDNFSRYTFLGTESARKLFACHRVDRILRNYYKLCNGYTFDELAFPFDETLLNATFDSTADTIDNLKSNDRLGFFIAKSHDDSTGKKFSDCIKTETLPDVTTPGKTIRGTRVEVTLSGKDRRYVSNYQQFTAQNPGTPVTPMEYEIAKTCLSNRSYNVESSTDRVLGPNVFERVFLVPVDPDGFEIDVEATRETELGRELLELESFKQLTRTDEDSRLFMKQRPRSEEFHSMGDYFVEVSLLDQNDATASDEELVLLNVLDHNVERIVL